MTGYEYIDASVWGFVALAVAWLVVRVISDAWFSAKLAFHIKYFKKLTDITPGDEYDKEKYSG